MTADEEARQVGSLMLEWKNTEAEHSKYQEKVKGLQDVLEQAGKGKLSTGTTGNLAVSRGDGPPKPITLPTTAEVFAAVERLEELSRKAAGLKGRLEDLGFS